MQRRSFRRALRPLLFWLLGGLLLLGWTWYHRSAERTTLAFSVLVDGQPPSEELFAKLDGQPFTPGTRVGPGRRTLVIEGATVEPYRKQAFVWFGRNDWGQLNLTRTKGVLRVHTEPATQELRVAGRLFTSASTNTPDFSQSVPVGEYEVLATFKYLADRRTVSVRRNETNRVDLIPAVGALDLSAEPRDADFRVWSTGFGGLDLAGKTPVHLAEVPAGAYQLRVWRGDYSKEFPLEIKSRQTNDQHVAFEYGKVRFVTRPEGAKVTQGYAELGRTPFTIRELKPGEYGFELALNGYVPVNVPVVIRGKDSIVVNTNLLSQRYVAAMERARRALSVSFPDYGDSLAGAEEALREQPGDAEAAALKTKLEAALKQAEQKTSEESAAAEKKDRAVATTLPLPPRGTSNSTARAAPGPASRDASNRENLAQENFRKVTEEQKDCGYFDLYAWKTKGTFAHAREALVRYAEKGPDKWTLGPEGKVDEKMTVLELLPKGTFTDRKVAFVQLCELANDEVEVRCKIWIYTVVNPLSSKWIPVHPQFYFPNEPSMAKNWRERVTRRFKENLAKELGTELK